jgi:hypothetical protein
MAGYGIQDGRPNRGGRGLSLLYLRLASRPYVYRAGHSDCTGCEPRCECKAITFVGETSPRLRPNPVTALSSLSQIYGGLQASATINS